MRLARPFAVAVVAIHGSAAADVATVTNGSPDQHADVVAVVLDGHATCSGVVVAPRLILTAAHCVVPGIGVALAADGPPLAIADAGVAPGFDPATLADDLAVLQLEDPLAIAPAVIDPWPPMPSLVGQAATVVGFGHGTPAGSDEHERRSGTAIVESETDRELLLAPGPSLPCYGDSGGAVFVDGRAGEGLVGIVSRGDSDCNDHARAVAPGAFAPFLAPYLDDTSGETETGCSVARGGGWTSALLILGITFCATRSRTRLG